MSNLVEYAKNEFIRAGWTNEDLTEFSDEMQKFICLGVLELLEKTYNQGHSGSSIAYLIGVFNRLIQYKPLTSITGDNSEFMEVSEGLYQNKFCSSVFKDSSGRAFDVSSVSYYNYYKDAEGNIKKNYFIKGGNDHLDNIEFPYFPPNEPKYVFSPTEEFPIDLDEVQ